MNGTEICVLEEPNQIGLGGFLECGDGAALESEVGLEVLGDLPHQPLERQLPYEELRALLVLPDLTKSHCPRPETVRLLHAAGRRSGFPGGLRRQLLPRRLSSGGLSCRLLRASHLNVRKALFVCFSRKWNGASEKIECVIWRWNIWGCLGCIYIVRWWRLWKCWGREFLKFFLFFGFCEILVAPLIVTVDVCVLINGYCVSSTEATDCDPWHWERTNSFQSSSSGPILKLTPRATA